MPVYRIRPLPINRINLPKEFMTHYHGFGERVNIVNYSWYIEGSKENIIIDTGSTAKLLNWRFAKAEDIQTPEEALKPLGLKPKDIDIVIFTHMHFDHIHLAKKFENAKFVVQKKELEFAKNPNPIQAVDYFRKVLDLNYEVVNGDIEIVTDVKLLLTPGHTPGCQSVVIRTEKGVAVITGFCCIDENFNPPEEIKKYLHMLIPGIYMNDMEMYNSMLRVKEVADIVIPLHEKKYSEIEYI